MIEFLWLTLSGLTGLLALVFIIIVPLMIALEFFHNYGILKRITRIVSPLTGRLGFKSEAVYPLLAGMIFGISIAAGILIGEFKRGKIIGDQAFLVGVFLSLFHAIFEDTLIFVTQGAIWWIVVLIRLLIAVFITGIIAIWLRRSENERFGEIWRRPGGEIPD